MKCIFDSCELWNGLFLGLVSSIVFSVMFHFFRGYIYFRCRYRNLLGSYTGHKYTMDEPPVVDSEVISRARIKHLVENKLEIKVSHGIFSWVGEITMSSERYGSIVWQYENEASRHIFGFKKCVVDLDKKTLFVIGIPKEEYGTEIFKKL